MSASSAPVRRRRSFTLIELIVVIAVLVLLMAIALPSFLGVRGKGQDASVQSNITVAYHDAKAVWSSDGRFPALAGPGGLMEQLGDAEPGIAFIADPTAPANAKQVQVGLDEADDTLTLCGRSDSGLFFCLRANEQGNLETASAGSTGPSFQQAAAEAALVRSSATTLAKAKCLLPTTAAVATCTDEPGEGRLGWTSDLTPASAGDDEGPSAPTAAFSAASEQTSKTPSFAFVSDEADTVECKLDEGDFSTCASPYEPAVSAGEHTVTLRVSNASGSDTAVHTFTAWDQPNIFASAQSASGRTMKTSQSISYTVTAATTVTCYLDEAVTACSPTGLSASNLSADAHTARVVAANPSGQTTSFHLSDWQVIQYPSLVSDANPWAYFRMNESGASGIDTAGSATLSWSAGATQAAGSPPPGASFGRSFDGSGSGTATGMPSLSGSWTIEAWVKPGSGSGFQPIVALAPDTYFGIRAVGGGNWQLQAGLPGTTFFSDTEIPAALMAAGTWNHVALNYNAGTQTARLYVNGVARGAEFGVAPLSSPATTWTVGAMSGADGFTGSLDELAVYQTALNSGTLGTHLAF